VREREGWSLHTRRCIEKAFSLFFFESLFLFFDGILKFCIVLECLRLLDSQEGGGGVERSVKNAGQRAKVSPCTGLW
jgi:hypothetical protein